MPLLCVGEPTMTAAASKTSRMTSLWWLCFTLMTRTLIPSSARPSQMARAIFSVLCHMVSYTMTAFFFGFCRANSR